MNEVDVIQIINADFVFNPFFSGLFMLLQFKYFKDPFFFACFVQFTQKGFIFLNLWLNCAWAMEIISENVDRVHGFL